MSFRFRASCDSCLAVARLAVVKNVDGGRDDVAARLGRGAHGNRRRAGVSGKRLAGYDFQLACEDVAVLLQSLGNIGGAQGMCACKRAELIPANRRADGQPLRAQSIRHRAVAAHRIAGDVNVHAAVLMDVDLGREQIGMFSGRGMREASQPLAQLGSRAGRRPADPERDAAAAVEHGDGFETARIVKERADCQCRELDALEPNALRRLEQHAPESQAVFIFRRGRPGVELHRELGMNKPEQLVFGERDIGDVKEPSVAMPAG